MGGTWIVGGGLSGLTTAYYLVKAGIHPTLVEQQPRLGGLLRTTTIEGAVIEEGPDSFLAAKPWAMQLLRELGLEHEVIGSNDPMRRTYILRDGTLHPLPEGWQMVAPTEEQPILDSALISQASKDRIFAESQHQPAANPERSVADFVRDHYGQEVLDYLVEPLLAGVYGGDPEQLSASAVLPRFVELEGRYGSLTRGLRAERSAKSSGPMFQSLRSGWGKLVETLRDRLDGKVRYVTGRVEAVERGRLLIGGTWHEGEHIVLACPSFAAAALLADSAPALSRRLGEIPYTSAMTVALGYDRSAITHPLNGFGFLVPLRERRHVGACTWVNSKFPHRVPDDQTVLRCFLGSGSDGAILEEPDDRVLAIVREELRAIMGVTAEPRYTHFSRWPRSMPQYTVGHGLRVAGIFEQVKALPWLSLTGNAYYGIGLPDTIRMARETALGIV